MSKEEEIFGLDWANFGIAGNLSILVVNGQVYAGHIKKVEAICSALPLEQGYKIIQGNGKLYPVNFLVRKPGDKYPQRVEGPTYHRAEDQRLSVFQKKEGDQDKETKIKP